jgi:cation transport ATPase
VGGRLAGLVAVLACGITTYKKGWIAIRNGNLNINALMSIAVTGGLAAGPVARSGHGDGAVHRCRVD